MSDSISRCLAGAGDYSDQVHVAKLAQDRLREAVEYCAEIDRLREALQEIAARSQGCIAAAAFVTVTTLGKIAQRTLSQQETQNEPEGS